MPFFQIFTLTVYEMEAFPLLQLKKNLVHLFIYFLVCLSSLIIHLFSRILKQQQTEQQLE